MPVSANSNYLLPRGLRFILVHHAKTTVLAALACLIVLLLILVGCGTQEVPSLISWLGHNADHTQRQQYLLVSKRRHFLQLPIRAFHERGLKEHAATVPIDLSKGIQNDAKVTWNDIKLLRPDEWSVLWSFQLPSFKYLPPLASHHRINHFPKNSLLVSKSKLAQLHADLTSTGAPSRAMRIVDKIPKFMPSHFLLPDGMTAFEEAWHSAPGTQWIAKKRSHRGVHIIKSLSSARELAKKGGYMIAEYIEPLLINGHKWDVGIYVAVTSLEPLTIWRYENALFRFCKKPYPSEITEETDVDSYVVNGYKPPWEMPDLKPGYATKGIPTATSEGTSNWDVVLNHLSTKSSVGLDRIKFEQELHDIIVGVLRAAAPELRKGVKDLNTGHPEAFFEMWRWDFTLDTQGRPYLMEVNMSPNLMGKRFPSGTDKAMKLGVVTGLLDIVGAGGYTKDILESLHKAGVNDSIKHKGYRTLLIEHDGHDDLRSGKFQTRVTESLRGIRGLKVCMGRQDCSWRGDCVNSQCICSKGAEGSRCEILQASPSDSISFCSSSVLKVSCVFCSCLLIFWLVPHNLAWSGFLFSDKRHLDANK